jgi:hypothetical protein
VFFWSVLFQFTPNPVLKLMLLVMDVPNKFLGRHILLIIDGIPVVAVTNQERNPTLMALIYGHIFWICRIEHDSKIVPEDVSLVHVEAIRKIENRRRVASA